jgi:hypothetical protein
MLGPILLIVVVGLIYLVFGKMDTDKADKDTKIYIKKTEADVALGQLKVQQEELRLKQEILKFKREEAKPIGIQADYKVVDQIEDKSEKE